MDQGRPGERRTRDLSWGDARARALMHALARDAATRAGFRVCAIEVVRPKGLLEFVAIYGDMTSAEERLGTASRLADMQKVFADGEPFGHFIWIPDESFSDRARDQIDGIVVVPDIPITGKADDWHPMDMLVARIVDERGDLRALLYLDVPVDLRRPDKERLLEISDELSMTLRSVVTGDRARGVRRPHARHPRHAPAGPLQPGPARRRTTCCARRAPRCSVRCRSTSSRSTSSSTRTPRRPTASASRWRPTCARRSTRRPHGRGTTSGCSSSSPRTCGATPSSTPRTPTGSRRAGRRRLRGRRRRAGRGRRRGARHAHGRAPHRVAPLDRRRGRRRARARPRPGPRDRQRARHPARATAARGAARARGGAPPVPARAHPRDQQPDDGDRRQRRVPRHQRVRRRARPPARAGDPARHRAARRPARGPGDAVAGQRPPAPADDEAHRPAADRGRRPWGR